MHVSGYVHVVRCTHDCEIYPVALCTRDYCLLPYKLTLHYHILLNKTLCGPRTQVAGTAEGLSKVSMIMDGRPLPVGILDSALQEAATALGEMLGSLPETLPTDGRFTVVPLPSSTVAERLTSRMKHARAAGDVRLAREVRAYVVPSTAYVYAATRRCVCSLMRSEWSQP